MMNGKAVSRAIRGLLLTDAALRAILLSSVYGIEVLQPNNLAMFDFAKSDELTELVQLIDNPTEYLSDDDTRIKRVLVRLSEFREKNTSKTAKLLFMFMDMIEILRLIFILIFKTSSQSLFISKYVII